MDDWDYVFLYSEIIEESIEYKGFYKKIKGDNPCKVLIELIKHVNCNNSFSNDISKNLIIQKINEYSKEKHSIKTIDSPLSKIDMNKIWKLYLDFISIEIRLTLEKIIIQYSLSHVDVLMENYKSILTDYDIIYLSPILFSDSTWEKIITHELKLELDSDMVIMKYFKIRESLNLLMGELLLKELPRIRLEDGSIGLNNLISEKGIEFYEFEILISRKNDFMESLDVKELADNHNKNLKDHLIKVNALKIELEHKLKKRKFILKKKKHYKSILNGLNFLLEKQNPNVPKSILENLSKKIIQDLFYISIDQGINVEIPKFIKVNNILLVKYIIFLQREKKYIEDNKISISKVLSENFQNEFKGFSYQNIHKVLTKVKNDTELDFNGLTSNTLLMKMRY